MAEIRLGEGELARTVANVHLQPVEFQPLQPQKDRVAPVRRCGRQTVEQRRIRYVYAVRTHLLQIKLFADRGFGAEPKPELFLPMLNDHGRLRLLQSECGQSARLFLQLLGRNVSAPVE